MCSLKFRVWSLEQNTYRYKFPYNSLGQFYVSESGKIFSDFGNTVAPEVEQKNFIVEQYTGLKDKNGEEIYEGDIISNHNGKLATVFYDEASSAYRFKWLDVPVSDFLYWFNVDRVIGNIHENPELLKEEK